MELLIGAVGLAGLAWGLILMVRGGLVTGGLLVILTGCCFGQPFYKLALGPLPITIDRSLLMAVALQYVVLRRFGQTDPKPLVKADYLLFAFIGLLFLSTVTHDWKYHNSWPMAQFLFLYLFPGVLYWVVRQARLTERALLAVFACGGLFAIYLCCTAIAESHGWWSLVFPAYLRSPALVEFYGRGRGPVLNPAGNGFYQGSAIAAGLMLWPRAGRWGQFAILTLAPLLAWGVYATLTRSAWMGVGLSLLIVLGCGLPRAWRLPVMGSFAIAATVALAVSWQSVLVFKRDKNLSASESLESAKLRPILARIAWNMFQDRPLFGVGFGQYLPESKPYLHDRDTDLNLEKGRRYIQHNVFLSQLTELGLAGVCLWIALLAAWGREGWRLWRNVELPLAHRQCGLWMLAILGAYLPNGMFQDVGAIPMFNALLLFGAGLTTGLAAKAGATRAIAADRSAGDRAQSTRGAPPERLPLAQPA